LCTAKVALYFNLMLLLIKRKTTPERGELTPEGVARHHFSIQRKFKSSSLKYILHLKSISCFMLVRKHALSELQPIIAIIAALYHMGERLTTTIKQGEDNPKPRTFLHGGIEQTVRTRLRAPVEMSNKYRQLLKRGGRC